MIDIAVKEAVANEAAVTDIWVGDGADAEAETERGSEMLIACVADSVD